MAVNSCGARAANAGDNGGSVVQGTAMAAARARMRRATVGQRNWWWQ